MDHISKSPAETADLAKLFLQENPTVRLVGLVGDLGSGKSAFVKGIAQAIGIEKNITSPTFVIMKSYQADDRRLVHIDAYRLTSHYDLDALGFDELISDDKNLLFIEWPERVFVEYPSEMKLINFEYIDDKTRKISF